jgi:hypothetical protein
MANLIATSSPQLTATSITSPKMLLSNSLGGMNEWTGTAVINNGASVDLICNVNGYVRTVGLCNFFNFTTGQWNYGIFEFDISRYGLQHTPILSWGSGNYSVSHYQEGNVDRNWLRFTNTSGQNGLTVYFNIRILNSAGYESSILTRVK